MSGLLARLRGRREIPAPRWEALCRRLYLLEGFCGPELERLRELSAEFLARKSIYGAGGLEVDEDMRLIIAAQASVPILRLDPHWYRGWVSVVVYPDEFLAEHEFVDEAGVVHEGSRVLSGEAWEAGPLVLSWEHAADALYGEYWGNVLIHELAHKLDLLSGDSNGLPPLHRQMSRRRWSRTWLQAYEDFCRRVDAGEQDLALDEYAADDPGEFFAVACEAFFVHPLDLREAYPGVYEQLQAFFGQDPAKRLGFGRK